MAILSSLFTNPTHFAKYVPYLEANVTFDTLEASAKKAVKKIKIILSSDVYNAIIALSDTPENEQKEALRSAVSNLTMGEQLIFDIVSRKKQEIEIYKNERESMERGFRQAYFDAMDTLIELLNTEKSASWVDTSYYKMLDKLQIKTTGEFDTIYPIDLSFLFFFRCIPWQKEALDERLEGIFSRAEGNESAIALLKRALAKITISKALRRFDILEFPEVIRGLFKDSNATRSGDSEQTQILRLSDLLMSEAEIHLTTVETMLTDHTLENDITGMPSNPDAKAFVMF